MRGGDLDEKLTFQSVAETNVSGQVTQVWSTQFVAPAHVISQKGVEIFESARINAQAIIKVKMRYRDDITTKWRFLWNNQYYYIKDVDRTFRRKGELWLMAEVAGAS